MPDTPRPERFGRFLLLDEAGAGAMGTVYSAYDPELDRRVALKVLHDRDAARQDRIRREAMAMARVSHPNVVQIFEVGEHDGQLFIAMEFIEGRTLAQWQADLDDWSDVVRLYVAVGQGLAAAHAAGLVHRDFKPDNVLVGADGRPRVIDFGLARAPVGAGVDAADAGLYDSAELLASPLTRTGHVLGTPAYMSPEQMAGDTPTPASDQFAFAVALYEALYDQPPFPRDSLLGLRRAVSKGLIEPPPKSRLVRALHGVIVRALAPDPGARWPDMDALLSELGRHAAAEEHQDWRKRMLMGLVLVGCVATGMLFLRVIAPPRTALDLLVGEAIIMLAMVAGVTWFLRVMARTTLHVRTGAWVLLIGGSKVGGALVGVALDQPPEVVHAFDTVTLALMSGVATFMVRRELWPSMVVGAAAVVGVAIWPDQAFLMHDLALAGIALSVLWFAAWRPFRSPRASGRGGRG